MVSAMDWRRCAEFPDYEVSESGDVRRLTSSPTRVAGWRLRGFVNSDGYLAYALLDPTGLKRAVTAHVLVATAFLGARPSSAHEVAHDNGSRVECHYRNLRWATRKENHSDIQVHGTALKGVKNGRAKITEQDVTDIRREYVAIKNSRGTRSVAELDVRYGIHRATVLGIAKGKTWKHLPMPTREA